MAKISGVDQYKVPAFQRKRSLSAKARKAPKPVTALERMRAGMSFVKAPRVRAQRSPRVSSVSSVSAPLSAPYSAPVNYASEEVREMRICGVIGGYFEKIQVAIIEVSSSIRAGDRLLFESEYGLFEQTLSSMQIDHEDVPVAYNGDSIGVKVLREPKKGGNVYRVS